MAASMGSQAQLGIKQESTWGTSVTVDTRLEFLNESLGLQEELLDSGGIRGTRSHASERVRQGVRRVSGSITLEPNAVELDVLLPLILGTAESTDTFALADTLFGFTVNVDRVQNRFIYEGCTVSRATFSASQGGVLTLTMDIEGQDETVSGSAFPSLSISTVQPFVFSDVVISVGGSAYGFRDFQLTIDNVLDGDRIFNNQIRQAANPTDRVVTWTLNTPYGDSSALYALTSAGVACVATFTLGNRSLVFTSNKVAFPRQSPTVQGKSEVMLPLVGIARMDGSTRELVTTCDSSP